MSYITDMLGMSASTIVTKNFITGITNCFEPNNRDGRINYDRVLFNFEFLIDAPSDPQNLNIQDKYRLFIDRATYERDLPDRCYQIRCHKLCDTKTFLAWANEVVNALKNALIESSFNFDLQDLDDVLQSEESKLFSLQTVAFTDIDELSSTLPTLSQSNSALFITMGPGLLKLNVLHGVQDGAWTVLNEHCRVMFTMYEHSHMQHINVSILYGTP